MSNEHHDETVAPEETPNPHEENKTVPEEAPGGIIPFAHNNDEPDSKQ
ncbi:hypothetical protein AUR04nite_10160 [Glutamicibacter uratoxydans]|uniref:Uncharacterized protein n=1 Tax=Glutamicibacter uratoxydans TaxID=43667 RepID=A0A4Y4DNM1_GLUUR|nr:hypothetical protein [Glutamicibacter uratoxydans]GED05484.1 hypothetical protein AUR04nite_10160 [Glutamicibacter uratoxydans]